MTNMTSMKQMVFLVAVLAVAVFVIANVSATYASFTSVEVAGVETIGTGSVDVAAFAGQTIPVRVIFTATGNAEDVRVKSWIAGDREFTASTERFDVDANKTYSRLLSVQVPFDLDPTEDLTLEVVVESRDQGTGAEHTVSLGGQRESYVVEILDVDVDSEVKAGDLLNLDVVLKNRGRHEAEDTFVKVSIPQLGISDKAYYSDLSSEDQPDPDKFDSGQRRVSLRIPSTAQPGIYTVEIEAFNADAATTLTKRVNVVAAGLDSFIVSPVHSRSVAIGQTAEYSMTIVNSGDRVALYELVVNAAPGLNVEVSDPVLAVPAGTSRVVKISAMADKADEYSFAVDVHSNGQLVKSEQYTAKVEGTSRSVVSAGGNATVLLTVILAIIFVVLLVVLIVLLTRKPEKSEEFGESYY